MWREKLKLSADQSLRFDESYEKGSLGQEEIERYSILDKDGNVTGTVQYTNHTSIKAPFRQSHHVVQRDGAGAVVVEERWS